MTEALFVSPATEGRALSVRHSEAAHWLIIVVLNGEASHRQWVAMRGSRYPGNLEIFTTLKKTSE